MQAFLGGAKRPFLGQLSLKLSLPGRRSGLLRDKVVTTPPLLANGARRDAVGFLHNRRNRDAEQVPPLPSF
jgi:hypothetical protein